MFKQPALADLRRAVENAEKLSVLLPIAKSLAAHYAAVFERVSHITRFALRMLRNTNGILHSCKGVCFAVLSEGH